MGVKFLQTLVAEGRAAAFTRLITVLVSVVGVVVVVVVVVVTIHITTIRTSEFTR
jgi:hypothetical protein|tara:strand:- start:159 stop:323 length:165 start_codon:yes stop_codon:yes gene_type:complete